MRGLNYRVLFIIYSWKMFLGCHHNFSKYTDLDNNKLAMFAMIAMLVLLSFLSIGIGDRL